MFADARDQVVELEPAPLVAALIACYRDVHRGTPRDSSVILGIVDACEDEIGLRSQIGSGCPSLSVGGASLRPIKTSR